MGAVVKCSFDYKFLDFEKIFLKKFFAYVVHRLKVLKENLPKFGNLEQIRYLAIGPV